MSTSPRCEAVRDLVVDTIVHNMIVGYGHQPQYGYGTAMPVNEAVVAPSPSEPTPEPAPTSKPEAKSADRDSGRASGGGGGGYAQPAAPGHYTTTNVQERDVDEGDIVKTDGKYVYTLRSNELLIAKTWPVTKTDLAARVRFKSLVPQQLYLHGDKVVVQGQSTGTDAYGWPTSNTYPYGSTRLLVIDVKNRERPNVTAMYDVDGASASSRVVGDDLYLVQTAGLQVPQKLTERAQKLLAGIPRADQSSLRPWEIQSRLATTLRTSLLHNITRADIEAMLPAIHHAHGKTRLTCNDLYVPPNNMQLGLTAVARISLSSTANDLVGAMVAGGQVYASSEALYVAAPAYAWNQQGLASYTTQIHQFSLSGKQGRPTYIASGSVDGQLLNQFSMSEHKGDLRVAVTDWSWNGETSANHLFVMRPSGHRLEVIGSIRGLAKGERIYSGRMFGNKGYLVTFRQTDPLFTLDLSDPRHPRVVGELKINGFSSYIHPMGDDLLLTIGQDATDAGRITGLHLQIFDVSKPEAPTRRFHETFSGNRYTNSIAQADHHAFTYDPVTGTLALPIQESTSEGTFQGLVAYHIDRKRGFRSLGRIDHTSLADKLLAAQCAQRNDVGMCESQNRIYLRQQYAIDRSMVVDKYLLTVGNAGLMIHELSDLEDVASLSWSRVQEQTPIMQ